MQEIQLMKEMEALRAQLQQKEQALEDYKESDLYLSSDILGLLRDLTVPELDCSGTGLFRDCSGNLCQKFKKDHI